MNTYNPNIHHRWSIRLEGYDYAQAGLYFITLCCQDRIHRFGRIENGDIILNPYGQIARNEWMKTPALRPHIALDVFVIMPNHIHGIIIINRRGELHSPEHTQSPGNIHPSVSSEGECNSQNPPIQGECNSGNGIQGECNSPLRSPSNTIGAIIRGYKSSVTKQFGSLGCYEKLWQRNYYEHIIRNEKSYQTISNYIINNPVNWAADKFYK